ncbi:hypothetical protein PRIPAC_79249 [Pristionchus pacificus]|uniref:Uncharacterized protein n=1 Tax=Pristionchus pacificus TaxID=54126 RepID=A0A2A6CPH1_PRIPA|nr:hypothetical protein PRIPAC_79249 [Pristionchus pacificus]|eukprot:PDM79943.1 hypothetical protein PRIPAC_32522 [Pristionchus pacificus]
MKKTGILMLLITAPVCLLELYNGDTRSSGYRCPVLDAVDLAKCDKAFGYLPNTCTAANRTTLEVACEAGKQVAVIGSLFEWIEVERSGSVEEEKFDGRLRKGYNRYSACHLDQKESTMSMVLDNWRMALDLDMFSSPGGM